MKTKAIVVSFVCLLVVLFLPGVARAQSTDCGSPSILVADGRVEPPISTFFIANGVTEWFDFGGKIDRSYSIDIKNAFAGTNTADIAVFRGTGFDFVGCTGTAVAVSGQSTSDPAMAAIGFGPFAGRRRTMTGVANEDYLVSVTNSTGVGLTFSITVSETTLYNPLWSTFGGFETFYKIYNTTRGSCSVTLSLRGDNDAAVAGGTVTFNVSANQTSATRNTSPSDLNVADNQAGHAVITHTCAPGAIQVDGFLGFFGATTSVLPIKILGAREATH